MDLSDQLQHALYLPALQPVYTQFPVRDPATVRPLPGGLTPKDLDFLDPNSRLFHIPCALYSAGTVRNLDKPPSCMVSERDRGSTLIMGDSGGYQIINGHFEVHDDRDRARIFDWLNRECDFAMTLDIPTAALNSANSGYTSFEQCLDGTLEHLRYFQSRKSDRRVSLLNVLQGRNEAEADTWYEAVKDFEFDGWAIAGPLKSDLPYVIRRLLEMVRDGKLGGDRFWVHFLGIGDLRTASLLTTLRDCLRRKLDDNVIQISMDTSSPFVTAGRYYTVYTGEEITYDNWGLAAVKLPINDPAHLGSDEPFPYQTSPIAGHLTMGDLIIKDDIHAGSRWDQLSAVLVMNHNIYVQMQAILRANELMALPRSQVRYLCPKELLDARDAIIEIFESPMPRAKLQQNRRYLEAA